MSLKTGFEIVVQYKYFQILFVWYHKNFRNWRKLKNFPKVFQP